MRWLFIKKEKISTATVIHTNTQMDVATGGGLCSAKRVAIQELTCFTILGKRFMKYFKQGNSYS